MHGLVSKISLIFILFQSISPAYLPANVSSNYNLSSQLVPSVHITPGHLIIWDRCVPKSDEAMFRCYFENNKLDILKSLEIEVAHCVRECRGYKEDEAARNLENQGRPSDDQLQNVFNNLKNDVSFFFSV